MVKGQKVKKSKSQKYQILLQELKKIKRRFVCTVRHSRVRDARPEVKSTRNNSKQLKHLKHGLLVFKISVGCVWTWPTGAALCHGCSLARAPNQGVASWVLSEAIGSTVWRQWLGRRASRRLGRGGCGLRHCIFRGSGVGR
jgi:hypothetical protein